MIYSTLKRSMGGKGMGNINFLHTKLAIFLIAVALALPSSAADVFGNESSALKSGTLLKDRPAYTPVTD